MNLLRIPLDQCYDEFFAPRFARNALIWISGTQSEVVYISRCNHHKLYRVTLADSTETICDHRIICYIRLLSGIVENAR